ncbi:MAG TPA: hypothetical protein VG013_40990 [Gemmataceae bacterium]|jgi:hypothetical protein|nr:hypothetical protein [Gemmataceae bacterium]
MKPISGFVDACCLIAPNARYPAVELYLTYVRWCLQAGVPVQDQFTFLEVLECYGLRYRERKNKSWVKGVSVRPEYRIDC